MRFPSLEELAARLRPPSQPIRLFDYSPAWQLFDDDRLRAGVLVGFDLSLTAAIHLGGVDTSCRDLEGLRTVNRCLAEAIVASVPGSLIRCYSVELAPSANMLRDYLQQFPRDTFARYLAKRKVEQCVSSTAPRLREVFLTVSTPPALNLPSYASADVSRLGRLLNRRTQEVFESIRDELRRLLDGWGATLSRAGLRSQRLSAQGFFDVMWRLANPMRGGRFEPPQLRHDSSLRRQLLVSGLRNGLDYFEREGQFARVITMRERPTFVDSGCIDALQGLPFPHFITATLRPVAQEKAKKLLKDVSFDAVEAKNVFNKWKSPEQAAENPDPELEQQKADGKEGESKILKGDGFCDFALQVLVIAPDKDRLNQYSDTVIERLRNVRAEGQSGADGALEEYRARQAYLGMLPGHHHWVGDRYHLMPASAVGDLLPVFAPARGAPLPTYYLTTAARTLLGFHAFDLRMKAHNGLALGGTGSGKSFLIRLLLSGYVGLGKRIIVMTRGTDYHRYLELFGGKGYDLSPDDKSLALGPFVPKSTLDPEAQGSRSRLQHLTTILSVFASEHGRLLSKIEKQLLHQGIVQLYEKCGENEAPLLREFVTVMRSIDAVGAEPERDRLVRNLLFWTSGQFAHLFERNRPPVVENMTAWNLEPLEDEDLKLVALATLSGMANQALEHPDETLIIVDECQAVMKTTVGGDLLASWWRTIRKRNGGVWGITQTVQSFLDLPKDLRAAMIQNTDYRCFLKQNADDVPVLAQVFGLTEAETARLASLHTDIGRYADVMLKIGDESYACQLVPHPAELWAATSDAADLEAERQLMERFPNHPRHVIVKMLAEKFPQGVKKYQEQKGAKSPPHLRVVG